MAQSAEDERDREKRRRGSTSSASESEPPARRVNRDSGDNEHDLETRVDSTSSDSGSEGNEPSSGRSTRESASPTPSGKASAYHPFFSTGKRRGRQLPMQAIQSLLMWIFEHQAQPYPTREELIRLQHETGFSETQLKNWFSNARRRSKGILGLPERVVEFLKNWFEARIDRPFPSEVEIKDLASTSELSEDVVIKWLQLAREVYGYKIHKSKTDAGQPVIDSFRLGSTFKSSPPSGDSLSQQMQMQRTPQSPLLRASGSDAQQQAALQQHLSHDIMPSLQHDSSPAEQQHSQQPQRVGSLRMAPSQQPSQPSPLMAPRQLNQYAMQMGQIMQQQREQQYVQLQHQQQYLQSLPPSSSSSSYQQYLHHQQQQQQQYRPVGAPYMPQYSPPPGFPSTVGYSQQQRPMMYQHQRGVISDPYPMPAPLQNMPQGFSTSSPALVFAQQQSSPLVPRYLTPQQQMQLQQISVGGNGYQSSSVAPMMLSHQQHSRQMPTPPLGPKSLPMTGSLAASHSQPQTLRSANQLLSQYALEPQQSFSLPSPDVLFQQPPQAPPPPQLSQSQPTSAPTDTTSGNGVAAGGTGSAFSATPSMQRSRSTSYTIGSSSGLSGPPSTLTSGNPTPAPPSLLARLPEIGNGSASLMVAQTSAFVGADLSTKIKTSARDLMS